jgi:hypothetical protein
LRIFNSRFDSVTTVRLEDFVGFSLEKKVPLGCVAPRFSEEDRCFSYKSWLPRRGLMSRVPRFRHKGKRQRSGAAPGGQVGTRSTQLLLSRARTLMIARSARSRGSFMRMQEPRLSLSASERWWEACPVDQNLLFLPDR